MQHRRRVQVLAIHPNGLHFEDIPTSSAILGISLSNPTFAGPSLPPFLDWATLHFGEVVILFGDYLERHNVPSADPALAASAAMQKAIHLRDYIERCVSRFPRGRFSFQSAHDIMCQEPFAKAYSSLVQHFEADFPFKETVMSDVDKYIQRKQRIPGATKDELVRRSVAYILEELALFSLLADQGYRVQIYPGRHLRVFTALATQQLVSPLAGLNKLICIDLRVCH